MKNGKFVVAKDIPLDKDRNHVIPKGTDISLTHDCFYMNGNLLSQDYQADFMKLLLKEANNGWNYLLPDMPRVGSSII